MGRRSVISLLFFAGLCAGCAGPSTELPDLSSGELAAEKRKQQIHHVQSYFSQLGRLHNVAHRVLVANRRDCGDKVSAKLGFTAVTPDTLPERYRAAAIEALGLRRHTLTIVSIVENGPAAKAELAAGDELVGIDGANVPSEESVGWFAQRLAEIGERPVRIEVMRSGESRATVIRPVAGCSIPVFLDVDNTTNAATDGKRIVVNTGIMRIARSDAELAAIVGHELAHVTMGHISKKEQNRIAGAAGGLVVDVGLALLGVNTGGAFTRGFGDAGGKAFSADFEREADYVGTYYVARAGYETAAAENLWRAMAQENPDNIFYAGTHPTSPERFLLMQKTAAEIDKKRLARLPLTPEPKKQSVATADTTALSADR